MMSIFWALMFVVWVVLLVFIGALSLLVLLTANHKEPPPQDQTRWKPQENWIQNYIDDDLTKIDIGNDPTRVDW